MRHAPPWISLLLIAALAAASQPASGQPVPPAEVAPTNPMAAIRADRWEEAATIAAALADPVASGLVVYYRLLKPGAASFSELAAFIAAHPDWPAPATLERRRQEALAAEPDAPLARIACDRPPAVTLPAALARCADLWRNAGRNAEALTAARQAWIAGMADPAEEAGFLAQWGGVLRPQDERQRFEQLAWTSIAAATRQLARLDPAARAAAEIRLGLRRDDPAAAASIANLPPSVQAEPGLFLELARSLRRTGQEAAALTLWQSGGNAAQAALDGNAGTASGRLGEFWNERQRLARQLLRSGQDRAAYDLVRAQAPAAGEAGSDAAFLAGFIALRRLSRPDLAAQHFAALAALSRAVLTQARANYWLGRARAAADQDPRPAYAAAAALPVSFYGQLAAVALGEGPAAIALRINAMRDPAWTNLEVEAMGGSDLVHAAILLAGWGEPRRAQNFVQRLDELAAEPSGRSLAARFAIALGLPPTAVAVARRMGRDGIALPEAGWPAPFTPPGGAVDPSLTLALIRQESSFEETAISPAGARGLMQLMPATAELVARRLGQTVAVGALTTDPALNMRLGTAYLRGLQDRFAGSLPLAIAAYNAGPNRVDAWLAENGDPRLSAEAAGSAGQDRVSMLDWIELIPFPETRNYVQRVMENLVIYRAKQGDNTPVLEPRWNR